VREGDYLVACFFFSIVVRVFPHNGLLVVRIFRGEENEG
jgi:hypothetical protein